MFSFCRNAVIVGAALLFVVAVAGCDSGGSATVVLNANSPEPPIVEYAYRYTSDNLNANDEVEVVSQASDDLTSVLQSNGFQRSDVVSARVDSVTLERISAPTQSATSRPRALPKPKVFQYLLGASVYLGENDSGPPIAGGQFQTDQRFVSLPVATQNVTSVVRGGATPSFLRLEVETPSNVPEPPNEDAVEVKVYYRIEVEGV